VDNRYLAAGGVGVLVIAAVAAALFFLMPKTAETLGTGGGDRESVLAISPDEPGIGDPNAPIKFIEYASASCPHCAAFHVQIVPEIKKNWIDKGLVYYVLRDYPLDNIAAAAHMIARCLPKERFYPFLDVLFANQQFWHSQGVADPKEALIELSRRAGLSREQVESCLKDQGLLGRIQKSRDDAEKVLGVNATPTMFINGEKMGAAAYNDFDAKFKTLVPAGQ
jgi:protein-disulfide isomerase